MIDLRLGRYQDTLADVTCDALIVDAPYSARTHGGHDGAPTVAERRSALAASLRTTHGRHDTSGGRQSLNYDGWTTEDVVDCVEFWHPRTRGWFVTITDHVLAPAWETALAAKGRYVFAPLPWLARGSRVRLTGDGPSSWTCWIVVARPSPDKRVGRVAEWESFRDGTPFSKWGTLPGGYNITAGPRRNRLVTGAKPLALMLALVRDYSRPGDTVCDPCAGGGTTLAAAHKLGRDAIGSEMDPETHHKASVRLGLRQPTAEDADWHHRRDQREDKGIEGLPMFSAVDSSKDLTP